MPTGEERADAFRRMYEDHYSSIASYAHRRLPPQDADDLVAETFLVAWRRLDDIPAGELTRPWLYAVARRTLSESRRSQQRWDRLVGRIGSLRRTEETIVTTDVVEDRDAVRRALARLRPQDQELLLLAEWEELDHRALGHVFGCSPNAIAIRLHRAHRRFSKAIDAADQDIVADTKPEDPR